MFTASTASVVIIRLDRSSMSLRIQLPEDLLSVPILSPNVMTMISLVAPGGCAGPLLGGSESIPRKHNGLADGDDH